MIKFKDYNFTDDQLANMIKQCIATVFDDRCDNCPLYDEDSCRDKLLYYCMIRIQRLKEVINDKDNRIAFKDGINNLNGKIAVQDITIKELHKALVDKDKRIKELKQYLEDSQHVIADSQVIHPKDADLQQIVDHVSDICTALVQNKKIRPVTLMRYIENVIHDRERRRVWNSDTEEMK